MKTIFNILDKRSFSLIWWLAFLVTLLIIILDFVTGNIFYSEPFFVLPILIASWYGSKKAGILMAICSTVIWFILKNLIYDNNFSLEQTIFAWLSHFIAYILLAIMITNFRNVHRIEVVAADTDNLTSIINSRGFYAELANELLRSTRFKRVFSLAYIDIDNFKYINDSKGHLIGDKLLIEVAKCLKLALRATDTVARLGGDEFVCLLPETKSQAAKKVFSKVREILSERMKSNNWPVSFSVGMVTFETPPDDIKEAIRIADDLMYKVKKNKKNNIAYRIWQGKA